MDDDQARRGEAFRALHGGPAFLIPNPWDAGSARMLEALGFRALATTSSGFAFTLGRRDGEVTLDEVCEHISLLTGATSLPVSADLENGFGAEPAQAAEAITRAAEAGAVGGSIEDWDRQSGIYDIEHAVARVAAAAEAARALPFAFTFTARAENLLHGNPDLGDTIARLRAYEEAGADVVFAPGLSTPEQMREVSAAVSKPLNILARPNLTVAQIAEAGAARISVGGRMTWVAAGAAAAAARRVLETGDLSVLDADADLDAWLS
jgi:2-methylisocitrate lyase-like PEP mutase family enzyme